ncbi:MAG: CHAT domain-containing protein [Candidatus Obscuribacterales bacterium]|nr:CHAT domain-containing protein [Candidatus Obscuribacterales bacterium]
MSKTQLRYKRECNQTLMASILSMTLGISGGAAQAAETVTQEIPQPPVKAAAPAGAHTSPQAKAAALKNAANLKPVIKQGVGNPANDDVLKEVFALTEKPRTQESMDEIFALEKDGQAALDKSDFAKALNKFQDMYALCKEVKYGDGEGRALDRMATIYLSKGEKSRAKSLIENSMEVLSNSQDKKSLGRTRVTAAQVYLALDNPLWSLRQLDEAMKDFSSSAVTDNDEAARAMLLAAELAVKVDQPKEAVKFYRAAALYFGQCGNHAMEVNLHNTTSGMLQEMSLTTAALEEALKSVSMARAAKSDPLLAAALTQLASCQYGLCEYMNARRSLEEIQTLKLEKQPAMAFAVVTEAYGHALAATGSIDHAKACLDRAWAIMKDGAPALHKAQVLNALGVLNSLKGNYAVGIEQLRQAFDSQSVVGKGRERFGVMISQNLASALARSGENRSAKIELEGCLRSMSKSKAPDQQLLGQIYAALGEICLSLKEIPQADAYLKRSVEVAGKINDDATLWRDYANQAKLQIAMQQPAAETLASAASCFRSPQAGVFTTAESNPFPTTRDELGSELISMLLTNNMVEQAFITAEQVKEEGFINEWQKNGGEVKPNDRELYNDLVMQRAHLHAAENASTPDHMQSQWRDWMRRHQVLAADNRELARLVSPVPLNLPELVKKAQENSVTLLDYMVGPRLSFVFLIDRQGRLGAAKLGVGRDQLKAQINSMLSISSKSGPENRVSEKRLLQTLFNELVPANVARFLPDNPEQLLVFVPDSVLFNLPMAALVDSQGRYLVESHTLTTLPAVLSFMDNGVAYGADQSLVFSASNESGESRETLEANELSSIFQPDQLVKLVGQNADVQQLQEQAKGNPVFHFSAPLLLQDTNLLKSVLPITTAGADNKVTADTLFKMNLPSDLAVWSGTSLNLKDSLGGGMKVFSRGLAYAGIRNVLLSLWVEQNPQRTELLLEFYKGRQQGLSQAQSLRKAQLLSLAKDPSPRSWAAFELIGVGH